MSEDSTSHEALERLATILIEQAEAELSVDSVHIPKT